MNNKKHTILGSLFAAMLSTVVLFTSFLSRPPDPRLVKASVPVFGAVHISNAEVKPVELISDGDMESSEIGHWLTNRRGVITKEKTDPHSGNQVLRIAHKGFSLPYVYREALISHTNYRVMGWARGDGEGSGIPQIFNGSILWSGTNSNDWQPFDLKFTASEKALYFQGALTDGYVEFDSVSLIEIDESIKPGDRLRFTLTSMRVADIDGHNINMHICPGNTKFFDYKTDFCNGATATICSAYRIDSTIENAVCEEEKPTLVPRGSSKGEKYIKVYVEDEFKNPGNGENLQSFTVQ